MTDAGEVTRGLPIYDQFINHEAETGTCRPRGT